jgi:hypothetical protein
MNETFTPKEDFIPTLADMINGTAHLTDEQLENMRKHIELLQTERKTKRRKELKKKFINAFEEYRAEFPYDTCYIEIQDEEGDYIDRDLLDLIEDNIGNF